MARADKAAHPGWTEALRQATELALSGNDAGFESEKKKLAAEYNNRLKSGAVALKTVEEWLSKTADQLREEYALKETGRSPARSTDGSTSSRDGGNLDDRSAAQGGLPPVPNQPEPTQPGALQQPAAPPIHVYPHHSELPPGIRRRPAISNDMVKMIQDICAALMIPEEAPAVPGVWDWAAVLAEIGDYVASQEFLEEQKERYEYQGFEAKVVAKAMSVAGDSKLFRGATAVFRERMTLVIIALMRGAKLDKVRKGMNPDVLGSFDTLVRHYHIESKPFLTTTITLPRIIAVHPALAMDVLRVLELGPVKHSVMTAMVPNYPRHVMFSAFPALVPRNVPGVTDPLVSGYLLYQHQVSLVINKEYPKWDTAKQKASIETFAQAALASEYTNQRQRVAFMVKEGWLEKVDGQVVALTQAPGVLALRQAAATYDARK